MISTLHPYREQRTMQVSIPKNQEVFEINRLSSTRGTATMGFMDGMCSCQGRAFFCNVIGRFP